MNDNDLFELLGVKPKAVQTKQVRPESPTTSPVVGDLGWSDSALSLDEWDRARGKECLAHNKPLQMKGVSNDAMADMLAVAYSAEPTPVEKCIDARRLAFVRQLLESPECQSIRTSTVHNLAASEVAAAKFADSWAELLQKDKERRNKQPPKTTREKEKEQLRQDMELIGATTRALKEASKEVDECEEMLCALGCGPGSCEEGRISLEEITNLFRRSKDSAVIRRIMELAGAFRRVAQSKQRRKVSHGQDDTVGIELGGDAAKLVPSELAMLTHPQLKLDAMRRFTERQMFQRRYKGKENVGKGPIIICVDESGSMSGDPVAHAKAFALSMAYIARHQNRWCCLIGYAGGREGTCCVLPPKKWNQSKLMDWLEHFYSGGTVMDVPMSELPYKYWPELIRQGMPVGKTDLIFVTDGVVYVSDEMRNNFLAWKQKEKVKLYSLIVDCEPGPLASVSDEVYRMKCIGLGEQGLDRCFSI